jgi:REP element-mobilizing transposase RayT
MIVQRRLPHWAQPGTVCFITFRTADSMPKSVVDGWVRERRQWLSSHGIDPMAKNWQEELRRLDSRLRSEFHRMFSERWQEELDKCHGECVLRRPELAQIVADGLTHFDGDRYELTDYVVMPNHVHVLAALADADRMLEQCDSWKHFTAAQINRRLRRKGRFWQRDGFDHLVRNVEQFEHFRRYIAENPAKARLHPGEYIHESKQL